MWKYGLTKNANNRYLAILDVPAAILQISRPGAIYGAVQGFLAGFSFPPISHQLTLLRRLVNNAVSNTGNFRRGQAVVA